MTVARRDDAVLRPVHSCVRHMGDTMTLWRRQGTG